VTFLLGDASCSIGGVTFLLGDASRSIGGMTFLLGDASCSIGRASFPIFQVTFMIIDILIGIESFFLVEVSLYVEEASRLLKGPRLGGKK
jgi:hypothetical protein